VSIPIAGGRADVALAELIHQPLRAGQMTIFALFTREPRRVSEVERWIARWTPGQKPPWPAAQLQLITASVEP
jgi:hypothetical protein